VVAIRDSGDDLGTRAAMMREPRCCLSRDFFGRESDAKRSAQDSPEQTHVTSDQAGAAVEPLDERGQAES
jgi:hypothetical protein